MKFHRSFVFFSSVVLIFFIAPALFAADTIYVGPGGNCGTESPCGDSIQYGFDLPDFELDIYVYQGTYIEELFFPFDCTYRKRTLSCGGNATIDGSLTVGSAELIVCSGTVVVQDQGMVPVAVPDVVGLEKTDAEEDVVAAGLVVGQEAWLWSDTVAMAHVIGQNPEAGVSMAPRMPVDLEVSLGPESLTVPYVAFLTEEAARDAIVASGLTVGIVTTQNSEIVPAGQVMSQSPSAGTAVERGSPVNLVVSQGHEWGELPPDPSTVAPPLDLTVATTLDVASEYLYTGDDPIQTGVESGTIDPVRVAVLRGKVTTRDGAPLPGAIITVLNHPEFGQTLSREDGLFDLAVNGGDRLTLIYKRPGYLTAQRQRGVPWQDYAWMPEVALIPLDTNVTHVDLEEPGMKVARGSVETDADGPRQGTILFPEGITAAMVLADGSTQPVSSLDVRVTEFTVGPNGPHAMPAELPPSVAYTYAIEISTDEAILADAPLVQFSEPVYYYVENFLGFADGGGVPAGYYDREQGKWVPSPNGRVIGVVGVTGDLAELDTDGDGLPDDATTLAALGITDAERARLAALYDPGQSLWRVPLPHFTQPWDYNWSYGLPPEAEGPEEDPEEEDDHEDEPCEADGSIIDCHNQVLGERIPVVGTPFELNYRSDRTPGRKASFTLNIPLTGEEVHDDLLYVKRMIEVAGNPIDTSPYYARFNDPVANMSDVFTWDGTDAAGRFVQGMQRVEVEICYGYEAYYYETPAEIKASFGSAGGSVGYSISVAQRTAIGVTATGGMEYTGGIIEMCRTWEGLIGNFDARSNRIGSWSLEPHHVYSPTSLDLHQGDGTRRNVRDAAPVITTVAGTGKPGCPTVEGVPATTVSVNPLKLGFGPDGSLYTTCNSAWWTSLHKIDPEGMISTVVPSPGPLWFALAVTVGPDEELYVADTWNCRIALVSPDGSVSTFAGNGYQGFSGDGGLAIWAHLGEPVDVDVGPDGTVYIADRLNHRIRAVSPNGIIHTVAGCGNCDASEPNDGGPATEACILDPWSISVAEDGTLYIGQEGGCLVRKVSVDGIISTVAGTGQCGYTGDGGLAIEARLSRPQDIFVDSQGVLYIADRGNARIRAVTPDGIIRTVAGGGDSELVDGVPAEAAQLSYPMGVGVGADGALYISDALGNARIRRVRPALEGFTSAGVSVPSEDGGQLHRFDKYGRHLETRDTLTGLPLYTFDYDAEGRLASITDRDNNVTTIERDPNGVNLAIVGPYGQRTEMTLNDNGYLATIANPAGETHVFTYSDDGLLETMTDPRGGTYRAFYDEYGRLVRTEDPAGGFKTLARTELEDGYEVARTTALGRTTTYRSRTLPTGDRERVNTFPDGTQSQTVIDNDGTTVITNSDGTVMTRVSGPDPRFGMLSPIMTSFTTQTPGGLTSVFGGDQEVTLTDPYDLLSLETRTVTYTCNGRTSVETFDAATHELVSTTPDGRQTTTTLDLNGRVAQIAEAGLLPTDFTYDPQGRLIEISRGEDERITVFGYDPNGWTASITDPELQVRQYEYDLAGRRTKVIRNDGVETDYGYDVNGNRTAIVPPIRPAHLFDYTPVDLENLYTAPDIGTASSSTTYEYDLDRQLTRMLCSDGADMGLVYDTAGRLSERQLPDRSLTYTYDLLTGQQAGITSSDGQNLAFTYDGFLEIGTEWTGVVNGSVARTYDADFRIATESVNGKHTVAFAYDNDNQITGAGALAISRDLQTGVVVGTTLGDTSTTLAWNDFGELVHFDSAHAGTNLLSIAYVKDKLSRITQKTEVVDGATTAYGYVYDEAGRLAQVTEKAAPVAIYTQSFRNSVGSSQHVEIIQHICNFISHSLTKRRSFHSKKVAFDRVFAGFIEI